MTAYFPTNMIWEYDSTLTGKLLYSKFYQYAANSYLPETKNCTANCLYCGSNNYCTSCSPGMFLLQGTCKGSIAQPYVQKDIFEREYKLYAQITNFCLDHMCIECSDANYLQCRTPDVSKSFCIRNASYYNNTCYTECPKGTYISTASISNCSICPDNCSTCVSGTVCTDCLPGYILNSSYYCVTTNCGDGITIAPEACDDGNQVSGDGCSYVCLIESGFTCPTLPSGFSGCIPICGDGKYFGVGGEQCDDGNLAPGDGCDSLCKIESGWWCIDGNTSSPSVCYCSPLHVNYQDTFSSNYLTISFKFSKYIISNVTIPSPSLSCGIIFSANNISSFGSNSNCTLYQDTLIIKLDYGNSILGNDTLVVNPGVIGGQSCNQTYNSILTVPIIPSQTITGNILAPRFIPYCSSLQIFLTNISGSLDRPYKTFSLTADILSGTSTDQTKLNNELRLNWQLSLYQKINSSTYFVQLPENSLLPDTQYSLKLEIINFQNVEYATTASIVTTSGVILNIQLEGIDSSGILAIDSSDEVNIRAVLSISQCGLPFPNITTLLTTYKQTNSIDILNMTQLAKNITSNRILNIQPKTLKPGTEYYFVIDVNNTLTGQIIGSKAFSIIVNQLALVPIISIQTQTIPVDSILMINGSQSYDSKLLN